MAEDANAIAATHYAAVTIVVLGASGDLAKKKTYPAIFDLARHGLLPKGTRVIGYARSALEVDALRERVKGHFKKPSTVTAALADGTKANDAAQAYAMIEKEFLESMSYVKGAYDADEPFQALHDAVKQSEAEQLAAAGDMANVHALPILRCYYLALPPSVFIPVAKRLKQWCYAPAASSPANGNGLNGMQPTQGGDRMNQRFIHRLIVEKPFGKDSASCEVLNAELGACWREEEIYRIDHYLGKEMVKNLVALRFANIFFSACWSRQYIDNVQITFKERIGTQGRGGYFDEFGIIRDIQQNHLLQVLALCAMERPVTLSEEDVRDEKVKVLKAIRPIRIQDVVLGQYSASPDGKEPGYLDDPTVPKGSKTPTYAATVLWINNERWDGVPFIMKSGKALNEQKVEVRIQFRDLPGDIYGGKADRNELVVRIQPKESIYMKTMVKRPGLDMDGSGAPVVMSELDLSYGSRYKNATIPDAYEALMADVLRGDQANFVRSDELREAWRIFTPILHAIDGHQKDVVVEPYVYGSRGPASVDEFVQKLGYARTSYYDWGVSQPLNPPHSKI